MSTTSETRVHTEDGWRIMLPPGWVTLPTEREQGHAAVKRLLDRSLAGKPRDELIDTRVQLDRLLRRQLGDARRAGAQHLHSSYEPVRDRHVSASLLTVPIRTHDSDQIASELNHVLGEAQGVVENGYTDAGGHPALRRVRRRPMKLSDHPDEPEVTGTSVDYVVQLPDKSLLVMVFTTVTDELHRELVVLFDAIADTLHVDYRPVDDSSVDDGPVD